MPSEKQTRTQQVTLCHLARYQLPIRALIAATLLLVSIPSYGRAKHILQDVRFRSESQTTRVVIELDDAVQYATGRLSQPDRLYLDLKHTKLTPGWDNQQLQVDDSRLTAIRIAQHQSGIVRIVLDLRVAPLYSVFTLRQPYRIVIDLESMARPPAVKPKVTPQVAVKPKPKPVVKPKERAKSKPVVRPKPKSKPVARSQPKPATTPLVLVIDPGHGGKDPGAIGPQGLQEKNVVLQVAKELRQIILKALPQYQVILTREEDVFLPLSDRAKIANKRKADVFISIHANASDRRKVRGIETWYLSFAANTERAKRIAARENNMSTRQLTELQRILQDLHETDRINQSALLAGMTQASLVSHMETRYSTVPNRGVDGAPFMVLLRTSMPSVLVEIGFVSNPQEEKQLRQPAYQKSLAQGIFAGMHEFLRTSVVKPE